MHLKIFQKSNHFLPSSPLLFPEFATAASAVRSPHATHVTLRLFVPPHPPPLSLLLGHQPSSTSSPYLVPDPLMNPHSSRSAPPSSCSKPSHLQSALPIAPTTVRTPVLPHPGPRGAEQWGRCSGTSVEQRLVLCGLPMGWWHKY